MIKHLERLGLIFACVLLFSLGGCGQNGAEIAVERDVPQAVAMVAVDGPGEIETVGDALPDQVDFNRHIRPILAENCYACHGPDAHDAKADVRLHTAEVAHDGLLIVPGERDASEVWRRMIDERKPMPPVDSHKALTPEQIALVGRWIDQGAGYMEHWAYVPPAMTPTPEVQDAGWPASWIDAYTLAKMEQQGLTPTDDADRVTLIRRLSFDLIGLPPTPAEVDAFVNDTSDGAYEKLIDRLFASPHFGERLAVYWLDLVRYGDTVGYHGDQTQNISPYRDWVIWALNENLPYDRFIHAQLAGDLIDDEDPDFLIASAYNRLQQTSHEGGVQLKEYVTIYDADRVRSVSEAFMGATIGCAQCHDHKFDPYTAKDFYSLAAFFADIDDIDHLRDPYGGNLNRNPTPRRPEMDLMSPLDRERKEALRAELEATTDPAAAAALSAQIDAIKPRRVMISEPRVVRLLPRGDWQNEEGPVIPPAIPEFMGELPVDGRATRLDLAQWLTTPIDDGGSAGLTARVFVNRMWYLMYGEGLCTSLRDFGGQGVAPNHPELLDRLTLDFIDSGWDIKQLLKTMAMTRTYRLSSTTDTNAWAKDPRNHYFARQSAHRMEAEMIRDLALSVSGLLVDQLGGDTAQPYQPAGYFKHLNFPQRRYQPDTGVNQWRRGVYVHRQRQFLHPMLKAFDAQDGVECTARRPISNTPLAALNLLNDPTFVEASRVFARRVLTQAQGDDRAKLGWAMKQLLSRTPSDQEAAIFLRILEENRAVYREQPNEAVKLLSVGLMPRDASLDAAEHAAWAEVCRLMFNLHETIVRP